MPKIEVASSSGACYGVERALGIAFEAAASARRPVRTLGPLIHNRRVVSELEDLGVTVAEDPAAAGAGTLVIRAHGVPPEVIRAAESLGLDVVDATCPYVKRVHKAAAFLARDGYRVVVVGESGHPEVQGILGHAGAGAVVAAVPADLEGLVLGGRVGVVVQTSQTAAALADVVAWLAPRVGELVVRNTICSATSERQSAARELAGRADAMVVVGGRSSGNTRRLAEICAAICPGTHPIEDAPEIDAAWFRGCDLIGVTAGASTPASQIEEVVTRIGEVCA